MTDNVHFVLIQQRHAGILRILSQPGSVSVNDLAARFTASPATIRRDLIRLEREGMLGNVHGGPMGIPDVDVSFDQVAAEHRSDKEAAAHAACGSVR